MSFGRLDPDTPIPGSVGRQTVGDFWAWGYSNILTNNLRGVFAEFLVGTALGVVGDSQRVEWDSYDLEYEGQGIEVKSSAYLQSGPQPRPSPIIWNIAQHHIYDEEDRPTGEKGRPAKCYVLCVYREKEDRDPALLLDLGRWEFYVVPTSLINEKFGSQKTVGLGGIKPLAIAVEYKRLRDRRSITAFIGAQKYFRGHSGPGYGHDKLGLAELDVGQPWRGGARDLDQQRVPP